MSEETKYELVKFIDNELELQKKKRFGWHKKG